MWFRTKPIAVCTEGHEKKMIYLPGLGFPVTRRREHRWMGLVYSSAFIIKRYDGRSRQIFLSRSEPFRPRAALTGQLRTHFAPSALGWSIMQLADSALSSLDGTLLMTRNCLGGQFKRKRKVTNMDNNQCI